jgi:hypothetical protein
MPSDSSIISDGDKKEKKQEKVSRGCGGTLFKGDEKCINDIIKKGTHDL